VNRNKENEFEEIISSIIFGFQSLYLYQVKSLRAAEFNGSTGKVV